MAQQPNNGEFHRADPAWRRRMLMLLAATAVLGIVALLALHWWLSGLEASLAGGDMFAYQRSLHRVLGAVSIMLGLAGAGFAIWLFHLAAATRSERRWPPSHMRTSADVRIRYLTSADSMVAQMKGGALALALLAVVLLAWGAWLLKTA